MPFAPSRTFLPAPRWNVTRALAFLPQNGAGLYVYSNGVANLNRCQVYENVAQNVRDRPRPLLRTFLQRPAGTLRGTRFLYAVWRRALRPWHGDADQLKHLLKRGLRERWQISNQTRLQRPAGTFRVLAFSMQSGAGLYVRGTASLTNTNVYENVATSVHLHFEPS